MWIDTHDCEKAFHVIEKNGEGKYVVLHSDEKECEVAEFDLELDKA